MLHLRGRRGGAYAPGVAELSGVGGVVGLRILGVVMIPAMTVGLIGVVMLGWAYEGPRRFFRRATNRQPDRAGGRI